MNCELAHTIVHGYFDGELDAVRAAEFERHLEDCSACQTSLQAVASLHTRLQQAQLYEPASPALRKRLAQQFSANAGTKRSPLGFSWWLVAGSGALAVAASLFFVLFLVQPHDKTTAIATEIVDAHVRSLQPGHLTDVPSSDQHTVKPWFDGKLDFIPPVSDYSAQGFPLMGGRLDVIDAHNVAALVYSRRKHLINVFVWPSREGRSGFDSSGSRDGYNWIAWQSGNMQFYLVSDVSSADLRQLRTLLSGTSPSGSQ